MPENFTIKRCERKEYEQFLTMANNAFGFGAENEWFQKNCPHCTPYEKDASGEEIANHFIALRGGEVVGAVGAYPLTWIVSEDAENGERIRLNVFGIGQVSCRKDFRGSGVMTHTLRTAIDAMLAEGAVLGFLGGDRDRYGRFGFDIAGNCVVLGYKRNRLETKTATDGLVVQMAARDHYACVNGMYEKLPSYMQRDRRLWENILRQKPYTWLIGQKNGKEAYICVHASGEIREVQGDPELALALILWHMEAKALQTAHVWYPAAVCMRDSLYEILWNNASSVSTRSIDLAVVCAPDKLLSMIAPVIARQGYGDKLQSLNEKSRMELVKKMFGFSAAPLSRELAAFDGIRPLVFWLPEANNV